MKMNPLTSYGRVRGGRSREGGFLEHGFGDGAVDQLDPGQALGQWGQVRYRLIVSSEG